MTQDEFLTTAELLDYLQVHLQTVHRLIKAGQIPPVRVGREWLFRKRDIDGWLESNREARPESRSGSKPAVATSVGGMLAMLSA